MFRDRLIQHLFLVALLLFASGCARDVEPKKSDIGEVPVTGSADKQEQTASTPTEIVDRYLELSKTKLPQNLRCQTRVPTAEEIALLKSIRALPVDDRIQLLNLAVQQMAEQDAQFLPVEFVTHAVVGTDETIRATVLNEVIISVKSDSPVAIKFACARIVLELNAIDQVPDLTLDAGLVLLSRNDFYNLLVRKNEKSTAEFNELLDRMSQSELASLLEGALQKFEVATVNLSETMEPYWKMKSEKKSDEFLHMIPKEFWASRNLSFGISAIGMKLSDEQFLASIPQLMSYLILPHANAEPLLLERLAQSGVDMEVFAETKKKANQGDPGIIAQQQRRQKEEEKKQATDKERRQAKQLEIIKEFEDPEVTLDEINRRIPLAKAATRFDDENARTLAVLLIGKLKQTKDFSRFNNSNVIIYLTAGVKHQVTHEETLEIIDVLLPHMRNGSRDWRGFSSRILSNFCSDLDNIHARIAAKKVLDTIGDGTDYKHPEFVLTAIYANLSDKDATDLLPEFKKLKLPDNISFKRNSDAEQDQEFAKSLENALAHDDIGQKLLAIASIGLDDRVGENFALQCFETYVTEFFAGAQEYTIRPTQSVHDPFDLASINQFRKKFSGEVLVNTVWKYRENLAGLEPNSALQEVMAVFALNPKALTQEQANFLGDIWPRALHLDAGRSPQTPRYFTLFLRSRPEAERFDYVNKTIPSLFGTEAGKPTWHFVEATREAIAMVPLHERLTLFHNALKQAQLQKHIENSVLLGMFAAKLPVSDERLAIDATFKVLNPKISLSHVKLYTRCFDNLRPSISEDEKEQVFDFWNEIIANEITPHRVAAADLDELRAFSARISDPHASRIYDKLMKLANDLAQSQDNSDLCVGLVEVALSVKPRQSSEQLENLLSLLARIDRVDQSTLSKLMTRARGTLNPGVAQALLDESARTDEKSTRTERDGISITADELIVLASIVHPDDAEACYQFLFPRFEAIVKSSFKGKKQVDTKTEKPVIDALVTLADNFTREQAIKYSAELLRISNYITENNNEMVMEIAVPLFARMEVDQQEKYPERLKLVTSKLPPSFAEKLGIKMLDFAQGSETFIRIAEDLLQDPAHTRISNSVFRKAKRKPCPDAIRIFNHFGTNDQHAAALAEAVRGKTPESRSAVSSAEELSSLYEKPDSVGLIRMLIEQKMLDSQGQRQVHWSN